MADRRPAPTDASFDDDVPAPPPDAPPAMTDDARPADEPDAAADGAPEAPPALDPDAAGPDAPRAEVADLQAKLLRQAAEYQNYRRRSEGDRTEAVRAGRRDVAPPHARRLRRPPALARSRPAGGEAGRGGGGPTRSSRASSS